MLDNDISASLGLGMRDKMNLPTTIHGIDPTTNLNPNSSLKKEFRTLIDEAGDNRRNVPGWRKRPAVSRGTQAVRIAEPNAIRTGSVHT